MTYTEYSKAQIEYDKAISLRRSLLMKVWNLKPGKKELVEQLKQQLNALIIPPKPVQPYGLEVYCNGEYQHFFNGENESEAKLEAENAGLKGVLSFRKTLRFSD